MDKILRCGVCGLGRIGWSYHLANICKTEGMTAAAVADPLQERLDEAGKVYGVPHRFTDWKEMANPGLIDLAVIASPTIFHREQCEFFLKNGVDVFCDKPVALDLAEAQAIADTASKYRRKFMVFQPHRITEITLKAKEIIASGKLGKIYQIKRRVFSFVRRNDWQAFLAQGGGMLSNYGAHFLDQLLYIGNDKKAEAVHCECSRILSMGDAEDVVYVSMRGTSGIVYRLEINMAVTAAQPDIELYGDRGTAFYQDGKWHLKYCSELPELAVHKGYAAPGRCYPPRETAFVEETDTDPDIEPGLWYKYCRDYFTGRSAPLVPVEETLEVMRIIAECRKSSNGFWS